ncbi:unnamed protein product [Paramecium sonneborni]|uniref:Uncharacterized protein n=1 Tax=Paramecium sonneborni TaxID=65129 RepID=A0A8S1K771_9CILI|nr:unnamed protein product [Paramecium sonneborni]
MLNICFCMFIRTIRMCESIAFILKFLVNSKESISKSIPKSKLKNQIELAGNQIQKRHYFRNCIRKKNL